MRIEGFPMETPKQETEDGQEAERGFNLDFYVTDHSADSEETGSPEKLRELYADIKKDGIDSVRYDWRWTNIEAKPGEYSKEHLDRYSEAKKFMEEAGLDEPTIVLSSIPDWAKELYNSGTPEGREKFFEAFGNYVAQVKDVLQKSGGKRVSTVQVLNELNNPVFTPTKVEDLPRMCEMVRKTFHDYNPDIKLLGTLLASNTTRGVRGTPIMNYLPKFEKAKDSFDAFAVDYYPGSWHFAPKVSNLLRPKNLAETLTHPLSAMYKDAVKNTELLEEALRTIAAWGKEYEIGEAGAMTKPLLGEDEKSQRYFYDAFSRAFKQILTKFRKEGVRLPSRVGFYEAMDEGNDKAGIMAKAEQDWGMRDSEGKRKMVLQGSPHLSEEERAKQPSQLKKIISYLRTPVEG
jgi:hypothetical protein